MKPCSFTRLAATLACTFATTASIATEPAGHVGDWYGGVTLGAASIKPDNASVDKSRDPTGHGSGGAFVGLRVATLPVLQGWPVDLELGYQDIARHTVRYKVQGTSTDLTARGRAVSLAGRISAPVIAGLSVYGKLGVARSRVRGSTPVGQPAIAIAGSGTGAVGALGIEYQFDSGVLLRTEIAAYGKTSANSSAAALTTGVGFRF